MRYGSVLVLIAMVLATDGRGSRAWADGVVLKNGATFEGEVVDHGDKYEVKMSSGSMWFEKNDVAQVDIAAEHSEQADSFKRRLDSAAPEDRSDLERAWQFVREPDARAAGAQSADAPAAVKRWIIRDPFLRETARRSGLLVILLGGFDEEQEVSTLLESTPADDAARKELGRIQQEREGREKACFDEVPEDVHEADSARAILTRPTAAGCREYAEQYPDGLNRLIVAAAWLQVLFRDPTRKELEDWIQHFPDLSVFADETLWGRASRKDDSESYRQYILLSPKGKHKAEAQRCWIQRDVSAATKSGGLPPPSQIGQSEQNGTSILYVHNDTGGGLTLSFSGPEVFRLELPLGRKVGIRLMSGDYQVSASAPGVERPWGGTISCSDSKQIWTFYVHGLLDMPRIRSGRPDDPRGWSIIRDIGQEGDLKGR